MGRRGTRRPGCVVTAEQSHESGDEQGGRDRRGLSHDGAHEALDRIDVLTAPSRRQLAMTRSTSHVQAVVAALVVQPGCEHRLPSQPSMAFPSSVGAAGSSGSSSLATSSASRSSASTSGWLAGGSSGVRSVMTDAVTRARRRSLRDRCASRTDEVTAAGMRRATNRPGTRIVAAPRTGMMTRVCDARVRTTQRVAPVRASASLITDPDTSRRKSHDRSRLSSNRDRRVLA